MFNLFPFALIFFIYYSSMIRLPLALPFFPRFIIPRMKQFEFHVHVS